MTINSLKTVVKLMDVLQLPSLCTGATIRLEPYNLITLEVTSEVDDETVEDLCEVLKKFKLVELTGHNQ